MKSIKIKKGKLVVAAVMIETTVNVVVPMIKKQLKKSIVKKR